MKLTIALVAWAFLATGMSVKAQTGRSFGNGTLPEFLKPYDTNNDGTLSAEERLAARNGRIDRMQEALANSDMVEDFASTACEELTAFLRRDLAAADSMIRRKISDALRYAAAELTSNTRLRENTNDYIAQQVLAIALASKPHVRELVTSTIQTWDAEEMSQKLEATIGTDLQFIRLNGTFVGGLIGLALHALFLFLLR